MPVFSIPTKEKRCLFATVELSQPIRVLHKQVYCRQIIIVNCVVDRGPPTLGSRQTHVKGVRLGCSLFSHLDDLVEVVVESELDRLVLE